MPNLIILGLHPTRPMSGTEFTACLSDLAIAAYDLSFGSSVTGTKLGTADRLAAPGGSTFTFHNGGIIIQHYLVIPQLHPLPPLHVLEAAATAVIVANPSSKEYPTGKSIDIRLEIAQHGRVISDQVCEHNAGVNTVGTLSTNQMKYIKWGGKTNTYVTVPPALDPSVAYLDLQATGQPPKFDDLVAAINLVLAKDPSGPALAQSPPLTPDQSRHIAAEIVWNRTLNPPPELPKSRSLADLYTQPPVNPQIAGDDKEQEAVEQDRNQFEGKLVGYQASRRVETDRLSGYVFAASAALHCHALSQKSARASLLVPIMTKASTATTVSQVRVVLARQGGLVPAFAVPASYFYALGARLPLQVACEQRSEMARYATEQQLLAEFEEAVTSRLITGQGAKPDQAARRLVSLGEVDRSAVEIDLAGAPLIPAIVQGWLAYVGQSKDIGDSFWRNQVGTAEYLDLILRIVTGDNRPLINGIQAQLGVTDVDDLVDITDQQWRGFFLPTNTALLPAFTLPGTNGERVEAFIRHLRRFFAVPFAGSSLAASGVSPAPILGAPISDVFSLFAQRYAAHVGSAFAFGAVWDANAVEQSLQEVFPQDAGAREWLRQALTTIESLFEMTTGVGPSELQFSLMEALYARGFADGPSVKALNGSDFQEALTGTIAYEFAAGIYANAGAGGPSPGVAPVVGFRPVNPDGLLTNCVPPRYLSPLGPVEYLHELLQLSATSACGDPPSGGGASAGSPNLAELLSTRRGPLGDLHATHANLETPLPLIDLVNESLEALAAGGKTGVVYDTAGSTLAGHQLESGDGPASGDQGVFRHNPQTLFGALPEHSSPATPVKKTAAYDTLRKDFTSPVLPYAQALDLNRSYLRQLGTSRFETMRRFRRDITEFVIDPLQEPAEFQRHLWRYPVRFDIAREYLHVSPNEYRLLYRADIHETGGADESHLVLWTLYGFPDETVGGDSWYKVVEGVPEFLKRTGLSYCEFWELWQSEFVAFGRRGTRAGRPMTFPKCPPCCLDSLRIDFGRDPLMALRKIAVFIRLWRRLQELPGPKITFAQLSDICTVLRLFDAKDRINPDFLRQLAALLMLRDDFGLPMAKEGAAASGSGADRTHLLAFWARPRGDYWQWAVDCLLDVVEDRAEARPGATRQRPELIKLIRANLGPLARLVGFDPDTEAANWDAHPTNTLRFAEVLAKIYASDFTVGEILFLFTVDDHLAGDDPFPLEDCNEALVLPLDHPEDADDHSLWALRRKLRGVDVADEDIAVWNWPQIEASLREEFGYAPHPGDPDSLRSLGMHFFPSILAQSGYSASEMDRQYRVNLSQSQPSSSMWNVPPDGPFHYDDAAKQLWVSLPLRDAAVNDKLSHLRPLELEERKAVQQLYFSPRADLAPFALIFANFTEAEHRLIEEADEQERWCYFRGEFARFHARCHVIADHLAHHVRAVTARECSRALAWTLLKRLLADGNQGYTPWEQDSGNAPTDTWWRQPGGGAFAALLGLTGTGLSGEVRDGDGNPVWDEVRGPACAFGHDRNTWNSPFPTVLPRLDLDTQFRFMVLRNGFALRDTDGLVLGGGEGFQMKWSGSLLVEDGGPYEFFAGVPTGPGQEPDVDAACADRWRVTLQRGQRTWILLNRGFPGEEAPDRRSSPLSLRRGAYHLTIEFAQAAFPHADSDEVQPQHTGFELKYQGPDSDEMLIAIPADRLFCDVKDHPIGADLDLGESAKSDCLSGRYTSSLRDIRRTYQRAFKALLFAHRFDLSAARLMGNSQSEIGYMLDNPDRFLGMSYFAPPGPYLPHRAYFDLNLLPVDDPYCPPTQDQRARPSIQRQQALFDWWERIFDYTEMRAETAAALERPAWLLFLEAAEQQPDDPAQLVRHLGVDIRHELLVRTYFEAAGLVNITAPDLADDRWAVRVWHGEKWIRSLEHHFLATAIEEARPAIWASDDLDPAAPVGLNTGNANLTKFYQDGCFENGEPRRYREVHRLNDGLRDRARTALLAYLCGMSRVALPWGGHAQEPRDLTALLLQDVEVGLCERASRIEEAVTAVQTFVQRARLGLESASVAGFTVSAAFARVWDRCFATFHIWEACRRRALYRENWIDWDALRTARDTEAFRFLESELRRSALTTPVPGGTEWWPGEWPPMHPSLTLLQAREPAEISLFDPGPVPEGLGLLGTPERDARLSWLAPIVRRSRPGGPREPRKDDGDGVDEPADPDASAGGVVPLSLRSLAVGPGAPPGPIERLPLWIQAAVRLGTPFVRVAAAGIPPAATAFTPRTAADKVGCCAECGKQHAPVVDEYYFWLQDARCFEAVGQDAEAGIGPGGGSGEGKGPALSIVSHPPKAQPALGEDDGTSGWHRPGELPRLLNWESRPLVYLVWCRYHNGEFQQPRRSDEGLRVDSNAAPALDFRGRAADSLTFTVNGGQAFSGYDPSAPDANQSDPGFRYDMATDSAVVLPQVVASPTPPPVGLTVPQLLPAYPYFVYLAPGAHLEPPLFSVGLTVAGALRAHCRFEAALKWYELVFHPLRRDNTWAQCGPRRGPASGPGSPVRGLPARLTAPLRGRAVDAPCCPSESLNDDVARNRAVALHYMETLLAWADALMCWNSPETSQQAVVILEALERLLGSRPTTILAQDVRSKSNPMSVSKFYASPAPLNPRLLALYDRGADRLALVHACLNAHRRRNGRPNTDMPYWGNDPRQDGWKRMMQVCQSDDDWCLACCAPYRFLFLVQKAVELAGEVRGLGAQLLAAYEKGDAEYLASLRAMHERQLMVLTLEVRQQQWREADWLVQALQKTKEGAQTRQRYFDALIQHGLNAGEVQYQSLTEVSIQERTTANISEGTAQAMGMVPDFWDGVSGWGPYLVNQIPVGTKLAGCFSTAARILNTMAENSSTSASLSLNQGGWNRREQEWRHQSEVIGIEITQIERQLLAAERRRDAALRELNNQQRQMENAIEVHNYLRDKFTNHELYIFLQQETAALHHQAYELALHAARQAQRAFNYERGYTARRFLPTDAWDNLHEGLLAGERLQLALHQMGKAYLDANEREYELTKHISLRLHFPLSFLRLQATGSCEVEIPEWVFDQDYPGQYLRRIRNVTLTIPCIVGPYTGVHCRLTLLSSMTRVDPRMAEPPARCCDRDGIGNGYEPLPEDTRIVRVCAATEAIATSTGQNDSGLFELSFRDERYLPFEFAGAVSRWRIELPQDNNRFDFETLSDVVLHLNYTAREGGEVLRRAANEVAQQKASRAGIQLFDLKHDLPDAWYRFQTGREERELRLQLTRSMFPYLPAHRGLRINRLEMLFEAPGADPSAHHLVTFMGGGRGNLEQERCECEAQHVQCVASADWPGLYHGVFDVQRGQLRNRTDEEPWILRFPPGVGVVSRVLLFCGYEIE
jgi:hypothetical protein